MNTIEMRNTHLEQDKNALYQDIYVDGVPFQASLKKRYPLEFSTGRYKEEFLPRFMSKRNNTNHASDSQNLKMIAPIYGCQDNCCMYLFAEIEYTDSQVKWLRIGQDSAYLGTSEREQEPLVWLNGFNNLVFDKNEYERIFN
ncbi:hypothetical protein [Lutimonas sp.]|uniref:hypothetical protein n=1 Tax=Lutimonas sp. TaxID=1872403 RepID=UPI003D9AC2BB